MIQIAGITLPVTAVWINEAAHRSPLQRTELCADGRRIIFTGGQNGNIDIYIPKVSGELTRETVFSLKALADAGAEMSVRLGQMMTRAVFRYADTALDLKPLSPKQEQGESDSYYGTIRLLEV